MKKLISKITALSVGLAMVIGGVVALSSKKVGEAKAAEQVFYTLNGTITGGSSAFASESDITQGDYSWKVTGNTTQNPWRIGGNSLSGVDRPVYSVTQCTETVSKIELSLGTMSSITLNTFTLTVASDSSFNNVIDTSTVKPSASSTTTYQPSSGKTWSNVYFKFNFNVTVSGTSNKFIQLTSIKFYKESTNPRGTVDLGSIDTLNYVGDSTTLSYTFTPASGSSATVSSAAWSSSNADVATISGNSVSFVAPGKVELSLHLVDSLDEEYDVSTETLYVSNEYDFSVGDDVCLYSPSVSKEMTAINKSGSKHYGEGTDYVTNPNGTFLLSVENGSTAGTFAFNNGGNYLAWSSDNTLTTKTSVDANSSWYVVAFDDYMIISNAASTTREIWWNNGTPRFACYEGKTTSTSGYNAVSLIKIEEAPVRGTIQILNDFGTFARNGFNSELLYEFTPADGDSATITSHTWTSSNTDAVTINGDYCSGVGPGKAKITLNATDSNGQEYIVSTADFTVIDVVSGTYVKKTSVNVGDTVVIVCGDAGTQMADIANKYGVFVYFDANPAAICEFVLEAGTTEGSYALKHEDKYLNWVSGTDISFVDEKSANSSWTIEFDEDDNATIACVALDGDGHRSIGWNNGSPRFAAYKSSSGISAIQLFGPAATPTEYDALTFATELINLTNDQCSVYGTGSYNYEESRAAFASLWSTLGGEQYYGKLSQAQINLLVEADAHESSSDAIEVAMYRYDLITVKYGLDGFIFERVSQFAGYVPVYESNVDSSTSVAIIVVIAVASMTLLGTTLVIRKRKHQ